ncbi:MFS transporter [Streptomyces phaeochromogenes]|uniref:MFS transporter n=1 Tax=Streptomyces phaeochromogenes TaxID=1923 RepID=UPI0033DA0E5D
MTGPGGRGSTGAVPRTDRRLLSSAVLVGAPSEVLDFLLPLWAGSRLHADAVAIGALVAVEALLSLVVRPVAGGLCDRYEPRRVATAGAVLYAVSFAGYAVAGSLPVAFAAAAVGGAGGALFWVALRTWIAAGMPGAAHTAAYGALLSAEGKGALLGYLVAFALLDRGGYPALFWAGCLVCSAAAALLVVAPHTDPAEGHHAAVAEPPASSPPAGRTKALLAVTAVTAAAEAGLWMVLLLRLQGHLGMEPVEIAGVFAPGFLVLVLLPEHTHRVTDRVGRTTTLVVSFAAAALFAAGLGVVSSPAAVSALWALTAACLAAQIPVEQATVAAVSGDRPGRGIGRYESARLAGVVVGTGVLGPVYESAGWTTACLVAASASVCGAVAVPHAIRALRLPPVTVGALPADGPTARVEDGPTAPLEEGPTVPVESRTGPVADSEGDPAAGDNGSGRRRPRQSAEERARTERHRWYVHTAAFVPGQTLLRLLDVLPDVSRIWVVVYVIDTLWSWSYTVFPRAADDGGGPGKE